MALNHTINETNKEYMIFAGSLSSLMAIENHKANNPLITQIQNSINTHMTINNNKIKLVWIPSHIGIEGNEKADKAANLAHRLPISNIPIPYSDIKVIINQYMASMWQQEWSKSKSFLRKSTPKIEPKGPKIITVERRFQTAINRIKIGHTRLTHTWILEKKT
ncbi:hypothetical protein HELRODRAFT_165364 [Helobdella robusta]|uniref:Uncharacterized protein n=1 Tax=Helobdella robusta TaxID=6412 RepID=T1EWN1_HELRO|nr:hypothetical protein HELRODRAFT_165364 [Helobdella robusta]ESN91340.1 hypothetical protein HELRODRAFT_165364 [Helobdella robusta]